MAVKRHLHILYIYLVAMGLLVSSCGLSGSSFRIKGTFHDMQAGELYIYNLSDDNARLDTLVIQDGRFMYRGQAEEATPYILVFPNGMEQVIFVGLGTDLKYEATANDLKNYVVEGSEENTLMNQFRRETDILNPSALSEVARTYIMNHLESPVAIYLLDKYFVQDETVNDAELSDLLKMLKAKHPHNHYLLDVESKVISVERTKVGKRLPNVTLTKKDYSTEKLWAKNKDYHLIAFWSLWMPSGYETLWKLRRSADAYKDSDKLRIVAVSLDIERYRWEDAIRPDTTNLIEHYCDGLHFESPVVKSLGVNSAPCYILTDKNHKVLERSDNPADLEQMLEKYLK